MEVNLASKRLHRHVMPVVMISVAGMILSVAMVNSYSNNQQAATALAEGLVAHVIHVQPATNGLTKITLSNQTDTDINAGSNLQTGLAQTGRTAELSLSLR